MPKILVLGATGHIGRSAALSLVRSGNHRVYGLARSEAKARTLAAAEITPVLGSATDSAAYIQLIHDAHIDVVVDCAGAYQDGFRILADVMEAGAERVRRAKAGGVPGGGPKLGFVYTSGVWVHGETKVGEGGAVNEMDFVGAEGAEAAGVPGLVGWRVELEGSILGREAREVLDVAIARPGVVYGGNSWILDGFLEPLRRAVEDVGVGAQQAESVRLEAAPEARLGLVHADDVGAGIHALVDRVQGLGDGGTWPVFDFVGSVESLGGVLTMAAKAMGFKGRVEFVPPGDKVAILATLSLSQSTSSGRAKALLGWTPKRAGLLAQIELYTEAWRASKL